MDSQGSSATIGRRDLECRKDGTLVLADQSLAISPDLGVALGQVVRGEVSSEDRCVAAEHPLDHDLTKLLLEVGWLLEPVCRSAAITG